MTNEEKVGGSHIDTENVNSLTDLGYHGDMYTWSDNQHDHHHSGWIYYFPNYSNTHLRYSSDHCLLLFELSINILCRNHGVEVGFEVVCNLFLVPHRSGFRVVECINMLEYPPPLS
jgi:hypothetical protein